MSSKTPNIHIISSSKIWNDTALLSQLCLLLSFNSSSVSSAISIAVCESTLGSKVIRSIFLFM